MTLIAVLEAGVPAVAFLLMIAVGLDVSRDGLRQLARTRGLIAMGSIGQLLCLPAAAMILVRLTRPDPSIAEYLLLVAACPGGGMSNVYVYLARANTALSVMLTATSCLLAVITLPLVMALYGALGALGAAFNVPWSTLVVQLLIMAVIPVTLGAYIRQRWPGLERRHGGHLRALSAAGVALIVTLGIIQSADAMTNTILEGGMFGAGLVAAGMACGWTVAHLCGSRGDDVFTMLVEFGVRNLAIAMVIEVSVLGHPDFIAFGALALLAQAGLLMIAVEHRRRRQERAH